MAYQFATLVQKDVPGGDGRFKAIVEFTGPSVAKVTEEWIIGTETVADLKARARSTVESLNAMGASYSALPTVPPPFTIDVSPPPPPSAAQIAETTWLEKAQRVMRIQALKIATGTQTLKTDVIALETDVANTYLAGYLSKL